MKDYINSKTAATIISTRLWLFFSLLLILLPAKMICAEEILTLDKELELISRYENIDTIELLAGRWGYGLADTPEEELKKATEIPYVFEWPPFPDGGYKLMIIAPEEFVEALKPLVIHKNNTAMPAFMITLENIGTSNLYAAGRDVQEKIKLAICRAEQMWGIDYVMLVGDVDRFPVRYTRNWDADAWGHNFVPSDLYYSDLYTSTGSFDDWDNDNDNLFGEMDSGSPANWAELNQDQVDLKPDVAVGRIPASTVSEVETMVNKIIAYELMEETTPMGPVSPAWTKNIMFAGGNFIDPTAEITAITNSLFGYTSVIYDETTPAGYTNRESLINGELKNGQGFVAYFGHGSGGNPGSTGGDAGSWHAWYRYSAIASATNTDKLPVILAAACSTAMFHFPYYPYMGKNGIMYSPVSGLPNNQQNAWEPAALQPSIYDLDTMAEHFLVKHDAGAIAYIGAYTGVQEKAFKILRRFFQELGARGGRGILGDIWTGGLARYMAQDFPDINNWWNNWYSAAIYHHVQKMMLFGDPSLRMGGIHAFDDRDICDIYPWLCKELLYECGPLCRIQYKYIYRGCPLFFENPLERYITPVAQIDGLFNTRAPLERWPEKVAICLEATMEGLQVAVYNERGEQVADSKSAERNQILYFSKKPGHTYFLVISPGRGSEIQSIFEVNLKAENLY